MFRLACFSDDAVAAATGGGGAFTTTTTSVRWCAVLESLCFPAFFFYLLVKYENRNAWVTGSRNLLNNTELWILLLLLLFIKRFLMNTSDQVDRRKKIKKRRYRALHSTQTHKNGRKSTFGCYLLFSKSEKTTRIYRDIEIVFEIERQKKRMNDGRQRDVGW